MLKPQSEPRHAHRMLWRKHSTEQLADWMGRAVATYPRIAFTLRTSKSAQLAYESTVSSVGLSTDSALTPTFGSARDATHGAVPEPPLTVHAGVEPIAHRAKAVAADEYSASVPPRSAV